jgi:guanylate kinase
MNKYKIIAICGKSAAGKDTLLQGMLNHEKEELHEIISHTTRPPREGEVDGKNYHFISYNEFIHKIWHKEMLETAKYRDWWYGTALDSLSKDKINIGVFNRKGLDSLKDHKDIIDVYVVYVNAPAKTRLLRALHREENPDVDEIVRRYQADESEWDGYLDQNFFIENNG